MVFKVQIKDSDWCLGLAGHGLISCSPEGCFRGWGGNNERNHLGPRGTMREISIIVENSAVCLGPAAQGRQKLFPEGCLKGWGNNERNE